LHTSWNSLATTHYKVPPHSVNNPKKSIKYIKIGLYTYYILPASDFYQRKITRKEPMSATAEPTTVIVTMSWGNPVGGSTVKGVGVGLLPFGGWVGYGLVLPIG
jgi:hypothetical protein